jgi:ABC-type antimicrobial peptide transport system permease subunit
MVTLQLAFRSLQKNRLRAVLTVLGVVIGIAAVTTLVSVGQSAAEMIRGQFSAIGTNVIVVIPGTGILLNNQMDDFSVQPGVANHFKLVGAEANAVA